MYIIISSIKRSFSEKELISYIKNAKQDIAIAGQFRFVIDLKGTPIGCIDLYDYDWEKEDAGVGIVILEKYRGKKYGKKALQFLIKHVWTKLRIKKLYLMNFLFCHIIQVYLDILLVIC